MLNGIMPPTGGEGWAAGCRYEDCRRAIKERIGYMSEAFSLCLDLTVVENIRLFAGIYGTEWGGHECTVGMDRVDGGSGRPRSGA